MGKMKLGAQLKIRALITKISNWKSKGGGGVYKAHTYKTYTRVREEGEKNKTKREEKTPAKSKAKVKVSNEIMTPNKPSLQSEFHQY